MWAAYLYDTMTGLLRERLDIPSFQWSVTVTDSGFTTTRDIGADTMSGLQLPWSQIPGGTPAARAAAIQPYKRGIVLFWQTGDDPDGMGTPILAGALGTRTSSRDDVSLPFVSMPSLLGERLLVHESKFGTGRGHTSPGTWRWENLSWRGLDCEVIHACTQAKPGGTLPIDLPWMGEGGTHGLPADSTSTSGGKTTGVKRRTRTATADGYTETVVDGSKTTVTERHVSRTTAVKNVTETYTYTGSDGTKRTKTRQKTKTITTGQTTRTKTTVTDNQQDYAKVTTTTTTVTDAYDSDGNKTGSTTSTDGPHVTYTARQTTTEYGDWETRTCGSILKAITQQAGGPDMQLRPYLHDPSHIRFRLEAGSDGDPYLLQERVLGLDSSPYGGSIESIEMDHAAPAMRVYATGSGSGSAAMCCLEQDLTLCKQATDPWPLRETTLKATSVKLWDQLAGEAKVRLASLRHPLVQVSGVIHADDTDQAGNILHPLGSFWPGEVFDISITGYPDWPDGTYRMRLMQMSGDQTDTVKLKFDPVEDPTI